MIGFNRDDLATCKMSENDPNYKYVHWYNR